MAFPVAPTEIKASKELCKAVISACGGSAAVANSLDLKRQHVHKWITTGFVPLRHVYEVSQLLEVSPWVLSYRKLAEVFGFEAPSLEEVVRMSPLLPAEQDRIITLARGKTR